MQADLKAKRDWPCRMEKAQDYARLHSVSSANKFHKVAARLLFCLGPSRASWRSYPASSRAREAIDDVAEHYQPSLRTAAAQTTCIPCSAESLHLGTQPTKGLTCHFLIVCKEQSCIFSNTEVESSPFVPCLHVSSLYSSSLLNNGIVPCRLAFMNDLDQIDAFRNKIKKSRVRLCLVHSINDPCGSMFFSDKPAADKDPSLGKVTRLSRWSNRPRNRWSVSHAKTPQLISFPSAKHVSRGSCFSCAMASEDQHLKSDILTSRYCKLRVIVELRSLNRRV